MIEKLENVWKEEGSLMIGKLIVMTHFTMLGYIKDIWTYILIYPNIFVRI